MEIILLLVYPVLFVFAILLYYRSRRFSNWIAVRASERSPYQLFFKITIAALAIVCTAFVACLHQATYIGEVSKTNGYNDSVVFDLIFFVPALVLIIALGVILYLKLRSFDPQNSNKGLSFLILNLLVLAEILFALLSLLPILFFMVFGFGKLDE